MRVAFINPQRSTTKAIKYGRRLTYFYRGTGPTIAAYTPADVDFVYIEDNLERINYGMEVDYVVLSVMTHAVPRARKITQNFRRRGIKVGWGGAHPTTRLDECLKNDYADVFYVGRGELIFPASLDDFKKAQLKRVYKGTNPPKDRCVPRRDVLGKKSLINVETIQASEGCPYNNCNFCVVRQIYNDFIEYPSDYMKSDIASTKGKYLIVTDDGILSRKRSALNLFGYMAEFGKRFFIQAPIEFGNEKNYNLRRAFVQAGGMGVFVGLDSLNKKSRIEAGKIGYSISELSDMISAISADGISINAGFIFGFDNDKNRDFEIALDFITGHKIIPAIYYLTPYPNTDTYKKLEAEGRLFHQLSEEDWQNVKNVLADHWEIPDNRKTQEEWWGFYDTKHPTFLPKNLTLEQLISGVNQLHQDTHSFSKITHTFITHPNPFLSGLIHFTSRLRKLK